MKLAIFGATGKTGQHLVKQALAAGHEVIALTRTPSKLAADNPHLKVVQGDMLDAGKVEAAIQGADAVLSTLGPSKGNPEYAVTKGTENILNAMQKHGVKRFVISAGAGVGDPKDTPKPINHFISFMIKTLSKNAYNDMLQVVKTVREAPLDWTIVRVPMLTDQPSQGSLRIGWVGNGTGPRLAREDMAAFMLKQISDDTYVRQAPVISN